MPSALGSNTISCQLFIVSDIFNVRVGRTYVHIYIIIYRERERESLDMILLVPKLCSTLIQRVQVPSNQVLGFRVIGILVQVLSKYMIIMYMGP